MELEKAEVIRFIIIALNDKYVPHKRVDEKTLLFHDLFLYGDDINELFEDVSKKFDVTEGVFEFSEYFPEEGEAPFWIERKLFKSVLKKWKPMSISKLACFIVNSKKRSGS